MVQFNERWIEKIQPFGSGGELLAPIRHSSVREIIASKSRTMRYGPNSLLLSRDEIVQDKHQMALQSCLYHGPVRQVQSSTEAHSKPGPEVLEGSITHRKCSYGLATQTSLTITTSGPRTARGLVIFVGLGLAYVALSIRKQTPTCKRNSYNHYQ